MKMTINYFSRMLCALLLCAGLVATSCEEGPLENDEKTEQGENENTGNEDEEESENGENTGGNENEGGEENENEGNQETPEDKGPATMTIDKVTATTATFTGHLDIAASDLSFSQVTVYYSDAETFNMNAAKSVSATSFDNDQNFTITLKNLKYGTKYNYCMVAEVKSEKIYGEVLNFTTESVLFSELTVTPKYLNAEISGKILGLYEEDRESIEVGVLYSYYSHDITNGYGERITADEISSEGNFKLILSDLTLVTQYYYCGFIRHRTWGSVYNDPGNFTTLQYPYDIPQDLNMLSAIDLSFSGSANCYIVSEAGLYRFKTVKGNSDESVGNVASAEILWETFGTDVTPYYCDLISGFCYKNNYVAFKTSETFKEGNAVIAVKDAEGNILWSWHIWLTDEPQEQIYFNDAGTMMDRNLGATSATPGDDGALGLLYQWGRKDPFLGWISSNSTRAKSTGKWRSYPSRFNEGSDIVTIDYAISHPTTFFFENYSNNDWYWTWSSRPDNTRWTVSHEPKSIYDPCPAGWRVPDGGANSVWAKACRITPGNGYSEDFNYTHDSANKGMNFYGKFGNDSVIWYPFAAGCDDVNTSYSSLDSGTYWTSAIKDDCKLCLVISNDGCVKLAANAGAAYGRSVRCIKE